MKRVLLMVCSICLVLACLFGLFACVAGMKDVMNIKEYKQYDTDQALEGVATARDGIKQLQENKDVYLNGVGTYEAGLIELSSGKSALNAGYKEYYAGKKALEEGKKSGLEDAMRVLRGVEGISFIELTSADVVRHPLVQRIVNAYEKDEAKRARRAQAMQSPRSYGEHRNENRHRSE